MKLKHLLLIIFALPCAYLSVNWIGKIEPVEEPAHQLEDIQLAKSQQIEKTLFKQESRQTFSKKPKQRTSLQQSLEVIPKSLAQLEQAYKSSSTKTSTSDLVDEFYEDDTFYPIPEQAIQEVVSKELAMLESKPIKVTTDKFDGDLNVGNTPVKIDVLPDELRLLENDPINR